MVSKKHNKNLKQHGLRDFVRPKQIWDEGTHSWKKVA